MTERHTDMAAVMPWPESPDTDSVQSWLDNLSAEQALSILRGHDVFGVTDAPEVDWQEVAEEAPEESPELSARVKELHQRRKRLKTALAAANAEQAVYAELPIGGNRYPSKLGAMIVMSASSVGLDDKSPEEVRKLLGSRVKVGNDNS